CLAGGGWGYEVRFLMFGVGLTRSTGGGTLVTPLASATDGLLDLCIVEGMSRGDFARTVLKLKRGEHLGQDGVRYVQLEAVAIESPGPLAGDSRRRNRQWTRPSLPRRAARFGGAVRGPSRRGAWTGYLQKFFFTAVMNSPYCDTAPRIWPAAALSTDPPFGIDMDVVASRSSDCFASAQACA